LRSTDSAFAWIVWSIVVKRSRPARAGVALTTWIARPDGVRTIVCLPVLPVSCLSYSTSRPPSPLLSVPAKPITCEATVRCG
jgi:hypothetical protein